MAKREDDPASRPDGTPRMDGGSGEEGPPRPLDVVSAEVFGPRVADELRRGRGRPKADTKVN